MYFAGRYNGLVLTTNNSIMTTQTSASKNNYLVEITKRIEIDDIFYEVETKKKEIKCVQQIENWEKNKSKSRISFMTKNRNTIYVSDSGLNAVYSINLETG